MADVTKPYGNLPTDYTNLFEDLKRCQSLLEAKMIADTLIRHYETSILGQIRIHLLNYFEPGQVTLRNVYQREFETADRAARIGYVLGRLDEHLQQKPTLASAEQSFQGMS